MSALIDRIDNILARLARAEPSELGGHRAEIKFLCGVVLGQHEALEALGRVKRSDSPWITAKPDYVETDEQGRPKTGVKHFNIDFHGSPIEPEQP